MTSVISNTSAEEDGWVSVNVDGLKRKGQAGGQCSPSKQPESVTPPACDNRDDELIFQSYHNKSKMKRDGAPGLAALMQSQYFSRIDPDCTKKGQDKDDVSMLSIHPLAEDDPLEELFSDDGHGYLDDDPSEPCTPAYSSGSLTPSLIEELENSVSNADSKHIAAAFASVARKSSEKGQPTFISMRLVPKSSSSNGGLAVSPETEQKKPTGMFNRFSVVGPIDLADPDEVARAMSQNSQNAYVVTECHPGRNADFVNMDKEMQSDLLWDWSLFREQSDTSIENRSAPRHSTTRAKEQLINDMLENSILFPMTKKVFWERVLPTLISTHFVSVLVGVFIGRRLCLPQNRR